GRAHVERVAAVCEAGVALRACAAREAAPVELALERRAALARRKLEGRIRARVWIGRGDVDRRVRRRGVDLPRELCRRGVRVPGRVRGAHLERMAAVSEAGV